MNLMKYSISILLALVLCTQSYAIDKKEYTKEMHETYSVDAGVRLIVENKYGNINLDTWNKNEVSIDVLVKVKTGSQSKANKLFEMINIELSGDTRVVRAITNLETENYNSGWWDRLFSDSEKGDYTITYTIRMPTETRLDITNKYGNIHCNNNTIGNARLINKYGNIHAEDIDGNLKLELGYGNVNVGNTDNLEFTIKYSNGRFGNTNSIEAESKYSHFVLGNASDVELETKYDDYEFNNVNSFSNVGKYDKFIFESVGDIDVRSKYSHLNIRMLTGDLNYIGKYNGLKVKDCMPYVKSINVEGKYANIALKIPHDFMLDLTSEYLNPKLPKDFESTYYVKDDEDLDIKGFLGSKGGTKITADMDYGSFKIVD